MVVDKKIETMIKLKEFREIYVLMSPLTKAPYVSCNPNTFEDEIFVFYKEEVAKAFAEGLRKMKQPAQVLRIDQKARLGFFTSLFTIGITSIVVNKNRETEIVVPLTEFIKKKEDDNVKQVENPELHLTALYLMQELRRGAKAEMTEEVKELYEEMMAHFHKGIFLVAMKEDKQIPLLKQKDDKVFLPVFSDIQEFVRFLQAKKEKLQPMVVEASKLPGMVSKGMAGVVLNPFGVNIPIQMTLKK